jgi:hypothetical protein
MSESRRLAPCFLCEEFLVQMDYGKEEICTSESLSMGRSSRKVVLVLASNGGICERVL